MSEYRGESFRQAGAPAPAAPVVRLGSHVVVAEGEGACGPNDMPKAPHTR